VPKKYPQIARRTKKIDKKVVVSQIYEMKKITVHSTRYLLLSSWTGDMVRTKPDKPTKEETNS